MLYVLDFFQMQNLAIVLEDVLILSQQNQTKLIQTLNTGLTTTDMDTVQAREKESTRVKSTEWGQRM